MFAVLGAMGHVGRATCRALRKADRQVRAIVRNADKAASLREIGCEVVAANLQDYAALTRALAGADAIQIIIPLSPHAADPAQDMRTSCRIVMEALAEVQPRRMLLISDYGAHVTENIGMPSLFREVEAQLRPLGGEKLILRSAEHMHNWTRSVPVALKSGVLPSLQAPVDMLQPTIAAQDVGRIAADLLCHEDTTGEVRVVHAEGPRRYSAVDVAAALGALTSQSIRAQAVPRSQWNALFEKTTPPSLADLIIRANDAKNRGGLVEAEHGSNTILRGTTALIDALRPLLTERSGISDGPTHPDEGRSTV